MATATLVPLFHGRIGQEVRDLLGNGALAPVAIGTKPVGNYEDHADCVAKNSDKENPDAYCSQIERAVEGKTTPWLDVKAWKSGRTFEAFIGSPKTVDSYNEIVPLREYVKNLPFLVRFGYLEWKHSGQKIGEPIAWRVRDGKPEVRFGLIPVDDGSVPMEMKADIDGAWAAIQAMGKRGETSINGMWAKRQVCDDKICWAETNHMALWAVGWVANAAANSDADVTAVASAKAAALVDSLPGNVVRVDAVALLNAGCASCWGFFDSCVEAGMSVKSAVQALQIIVDRAVAERRKVQEPGSASPAVRTSAMTTDPATKTEPTPNDPAPVAPEKKDAAQDAASTLELLLAEVLSVKKRLESLELQAAVAAEKAVAAAIPKAFEAFDGRLKAIEALAKGVNVQPGMKGAPSPAKDPGESNSPATAGTKPPEGKFSFRDIANRGGA
jgi:hypothetical protein